MVPLAHAQHVLVDLLLFGSPVALLTGGLWWMGRADRRRAAAERASGQPLA